MAAGATEEEELVVLVVAGVLELGPLSRGKLEDGAQLTMTTL